jgi:hypothetical protein
MKSLIQYFYQIKSDKLILWCYLIWYVVIVYFYFDSSPKLWISAAGMSAVIGTGLLLSVSSNHLNETDHWQTLRLYLMPFCVSSFSALIKDQGFIIVLPPEIEETLVAVSCCALFILAILAIKLARNQTVG